MLYIFDSEAFSTRICLQDLNFNAFQGFCTVGADDLTAEPGIDQIRNPADVIDVGMGEKQESQCLPAAPGTVRKAPAGHGPGQCRSPPG
jgi:hypothetical protein